jgi:CheY-like chemotaxis protein
VQWLCHAAFPDSGSAPPAHICSYYNYKVLIRQRLCFNPGRRSLADMGPSRHWNWGDMKQLVNARVAARYGHFRLVQQRDEDNHKKPSVLRSLPSHPRKAAVPRRILVVEDNLDAVHTLVLLLREMGHTVDYAINGYAAVDVARRMRPEIVLLDLGLPGLDGFEVCRWIKKDPALKDARVFALTAYKQDEYRARAIAAGCEQHLVKPLSVEALEQLLS